MKILLINTVPFRQNGISEMIFNYYDILKNEKGLEFDFVVNNFIEEKYRRKIDNENIFILNRSFKKILTYAEKLQEILIYGKYDLVHIHGNSSSMALEEYCIKNCCKSKIIVHTHAVKGNYKILSYLCEKYFLKNYDVALASGVEAGKSLYKGKNFLVIKNGIEVEKYFYNESIKNNLKMRYGVADKKVILHVGRYIHQKNHQFILDIFEEVRYKNKNVCLFLIGKGPLKKKIRSIARSRGLLNDIYFINQTNKVQDFYSMADMLLFPSKSESLGMVVVESQYNGLHCLVSTAIPTMARISNLVKYQSLSAPLKDWVHDIEEMLSLERNIKFNIVDKFNIKRCAEELKNIYLTTIN
ncbi:glycosyltransferase [Enterococcus faecium]